MKIKKLEHKHISILIGAVLLISLVLFLHFRNVKIKDTNVAWIDSFVVEDELEEADITNVPSLLVIDVKGAVQNPGVYELAEGSRVYQLIEQAGGFLHVADENQLNLAELLHDEMMVYVPTENEEVEFKLISEQEGKIAVNTADASALEQLPGIGPAKAQAIIEYRDENGPFKEIDDLVQVPGIGLKSMEQLRDKVYLK